MTFANPLPWWAFVGLAAAAGATAWFAYGSAPFSVARRSVLIGLRFTTLVFLVVLLMRPVAASRPDSPADAVVAILVDTSRSMGIEDAAGVRRIDRAREVVRRELVPALSARFHAEVLAFGERIRPARPEELGASDRRSDMRAALRAVRDRYHGKPLAGIVVVSDGGETGAAPDGSDDEAIAPVFALGVGSLSIQHDREVLGVTAGEPVLDDSRIDVAVSAVSHGYDRTPIELRLLENGRPVDVRRVAPAADGTPVTAVFHAAPPGGAATVYTVEIPVDAAELVPENNARSVLVQPPSRPRRILLVQGAPGFEHSFLRRAWSGDTGLDVDSVVRKGANEQGADTFYIQAREARGRTLVNGFPDTRAHLFGYDAVVLANVEGSKLTRGQLRDTRDFVGRRGGGLLVLGAHSFARTGLDDSPLQELLPLDPADRGRGVLPAVNGGAAGANRVVLTPAGETHPIMQLAADADDNRKRWQAVPALAGTASVGAARPGATVLAVAGGPGGTSRPVVAVQRYGDGRSMIFTGEAAWRWRMRLPADDRSYDTFWRQAIRWLSAPAADPVSMTAPADAVPGESVALRIAVRNQSFEPLPNAAVDVRITGPDGRVQRVPAAAAQAGAPAEVSARFVPESPGVYRATADVRVPGAAPATAAAVVLVGGADPEMSDPRLNMRVLQRVAAASGGRVLESGALDAFAMDLRASLPESLLARRDLWHNGWSFAAIVGLLAAEWILRRRRGLR